MLKTTTNALILLTALAMLAGCKTKVDADSNLYYPGATPGGRRALPTDAGTLYTRQSFTPDEFTDVVKHYDALLLEKHEGWTKLGNANIHHVVFFKNMTGDKMPTVVEKSQPGQQVLLTEDPGGRIGVQLARYTPPAP